MLKKNPPEKIVSPVKRSAWLHAFTKQNFAWQRFSEVNRISIIFSQEIDVETGESKFEKVYRKVHKSFIKVHKSSIKALSMLYKSFIKDSLWKLYKSLIKKLYFYMLLKEHVDPLHTFKMWLNEYFLNCEKSIKMYWKSSEKFRKCVENKFKCSCNLCVIKVDNNLEIYSARSSLDLGNKIWIGKLFINIVFHFKNPRLGFSFLPPISFELI